jgi:hypothetical protein
MPSAIPASRELYGGDSDLYEKSTGELKKSSSKVLARHEQLVAAMTKATIDGLSGQTVLTDTHETGQPMAKSTPRSGGRARSADLMAKGVSADVAEALSSQLSSAQLAKEWSLSNPISTGLVPFDLEAPAKLLTPRPTPLRNSIPRMKGQGAARRFKVISGFTGTGTGGVGTINPGITESTTNVGPGGLAYIRPPYINYAGYDVVLSYVSWGLSDSVSWQAEYQGQGFEDIRSLSNTALLYSLMLMDERLMAYGRGVTANGYAGPVGGATQALSAVAGSVAPSGSSSLSAGTYWVVSAVDAGDLGGSLHQGATTAAASVTVTAGQAIQVAFSNEPVGALGYNMYVSSASAGPFFYAGRTGYNTGFVTSAPTTGASVSASAADASAVATNFDGLLTNTAASGGYVNRINGKFSISTPGLEFQTAFSSLYDSVKADPDEAWLNGHDRNQLSNAILAGQNVNAYTVFIPDQNTGAGRVGVVVDSILNQVTGKPVQIYVHPWFPQGNCIIRSVTLPIPDSNVSDTSVMALPQDYVAVQWPVQQFTYDASAFEIGTMCHYAPAWNALITGIEQSG